MLLYYMAFLKRGNLISIDKELGESQEHYIRRGYFVASIYPHIISNYDEAVKYSRLFINIRYNKAVYSDSLMKKMVELDKHLFSE